MQWQELRQREANSHGDKNCICNGHSIGDDDGDSNGNDDGNNSNHTKKEPYSLACRFLFGTLISLQDCTKCVKSYCQHATFIMKKYHHMICILTLHFGVIGVLTIMLEELNL